MLAAQALSVGAATLALVGLAAFLGHLYPIFFGFKGGKGVATTLGVLLGISWWVGLVTAATWLAMAAVFRISSLSALTAMLMAPLYTHLFTHSKELVIGTAVMSAVLYWRHRSNIGRLLRGEEGRMGKRRESQSSN